MLANGSPINSFYDGHGTNKYTVALSEAKMFISGGNGIVEENGNIHFSLIAVKNLGRNFIKNIILDVGIGFGKSKEQAHRLVCGRWYRSGRFDCEDS